jgi:hypothetical protein
MMARTVVTPLLVFVFNRMDEVIQPQPPSCTSMNLRVLNIFPSLFTVAMMFDDCCIFIRVEIKPTQLGKRSKFAINGFGFLSTKMVIDSILGKSVFILTGTTAPFSTTE